MKIINKPVLKMIVYCFILGLIASCKPSEKNHEVPSILKILNYCTERVYKENVENCFSKGASDEDWKHYGNAVFALYSNRIDIYNNELGKISGKDSAWYLAGKFEEAFFKNNLVDAKNFLNNLKNSDLGKDDVFLLESESAILAREGYWNHLEDVLKKIPKDTILSGGYLPFYQAIILLNKGETGEVLSIVEELKRMDNNVYELIYLDYLLYLPDEKRAQSLYEQSTDPSLAMRYGIYLFETGKLDEAKNIIRSSLDSDKGAMDRVISTAIYMMRFGFHDFAKEIMSKYFPPVSMDFYNKYWGDSPDYCLYLAWELFANAKIYDAEEYLEKSLSFAPRDYEGNWLKFNICGLKGDINCQEETMKILSDHDPEGMAVVKDMIKRFDERHQNNFESN